MRVPVHILAFKSLIIFFAVHLTADPVHGQTAQSAFRAVTWGMTPDEVHTLEPGTHLRSDANEDLGVGCVEVYFDVIRGKVGTVTYGFQKDHLVYGAYRFKLNKDDRSFSQMMGEHMRSRYGESKRVEVSGDGKTIQLHWSTPQTRVIARFAPTSLQIHFWETSHWAQQENPSAWVGKLDE